MITLPWIRRSARKPALQARQHPDLAIEPHWALYVWEGPPDQDPFPQDLAEWMRLRPPYRQGCAANVASALSWAHNRIERSWSQLSPPLGGVSIGHVQAELDMRLTCDRQAILDLSTGHGLKWVLGVLSAPLCLSPSACHA